MSGIILALSGTPVLLKNMIVSLSMGFAEEDQSGQTSSTTKSEQGVKAKELKVSGLIDFDTPELLTQLFSLAEAKDASGKLQQYRVASLLAQSVNFREATFSGSLEITEQADKMAWQIGFTLKEHVSVSEKRQARAGKQKPQTQSTAEDGSVTVEDLSEPEETLSWFEEKVLKPTNDTLGGLG